MISKAIPVFIMFMRRSSLLLAILLAILSLGACSFPKGMEQVTLSEYEPAFRNPMKGLREFFDPGQDLRREDYPYPYGSMIKEYMPWDKMENLEGDGVDKVIAYSNHRWQGVEDMNMKVIPRPFIIWVEPWHGGHPADPGFEDDMDGWHWPSDLPGEVGPYKQIPGSVGAYVDPADSLTPIIGGYFDPRFPDRVEKFVKKLGEAWDDDPRVAYVEMGIIGEWGEHHDPDISTFWPPHDEPVHVENRTWLPGIEKVLGDAFTKYFHNKKVMVRYAYEFKDYEFGIYWDSWAIDDEIERGYGQMIKLGDRWKTQVIGGEITWNWGSLRRKGFRSFEDCVADEHTHELIIEQIRNLHCNHLGGITWANFSRKQFIGDVQDVQKSLGYRFVIDKAFYYGTIVPGKPWKLGFSLTNTGSSPFYYDWPVCVYLLDPESHAEVWRCMLDDVDIRQWMPGENYSIEAGRYLSAPKRYEINEKLDVAEIAEGEYIVALSILDPAGLLPSVRFANNEYFEGGYTVLGKVGVGCRAADPAIPSEEYYDLQSDRTLHYVINK